MAQKSGDPSWKLRCQDTAIAPNDIKRESKQVTLVPNWDNTRVSRMKDILDAKFNPKTEPTLAAMLLETGSEELQEGNSWGDEFWGVNTTTGKGENWLGRLLMEVRNDLKHEQPT